MILYMILYMIGIGLFVFEIFKLYWLIIIIIIILTTSIEITVVLKLKNIIIIYSPLGTIFCMQHIFIKKPYLKNDDKVNIIQINWCQLKPIYLKWS